MGKVLAALAAVFAFTFFAPVIGVLFGAFSGWVVGIFFHDTIIGFLTRAGFDVTGFALWQIGASLGFIGSFFRGATTSTSK